MKVIDVSQALGIVLGQYFTRVVSGEFKGMAVKKGHIIKVEDIPMLHSMGNNKVRFYISRRFRKPSRVVRTCSGF
jgi:hypothetical protein